MKIYFLLICFLFVGCEVEKDRKIEEDTQSRRDEVGEIVYSENPEKSIISKALFDAIVDYIKLFESESEKPQVYEIIFSKYQDTCYVSILISSFHKRKFLGFTYINDIIIAFKRLNECSKDLVDENRLQPTSEKYELGEELEEYDNFPRIYAIYGEENLERLKYEDLKKFKGKIRTRILYGE